MVNVKEEIKKYGLSIDEYESCIDTIATKKIQEEDLSWQSICDSYNVGISKESLRKASSTIFGGSFVYQYFKEKYENENSSINTIESKTNASSFSMNKDGSYSSTKVLEMTEEDSKSESYMLKAHGFDTKEWRIVSARNTIRQVFNRNGKAVVLYSSFITVKPLANVNFDFVKELYDELKASQNDFQDVPKMENTSGLLLEIPITDLHFGKLCSKEDFEEHYNFELAQKRFHFVIDDVIKSVDGMRIEKIIFPIGSDYFHVDNYNSTTTKGTQQHTDLSPQLIFKYGLKCLIDGILKLSKIAPVDVFCINGNHDFLTSFHAICSLDCYFANNPNVKIDTSPMPRKYVEFGNVLIGFSHGDKERNRIDGIMQVEASESWGRTKYREFHLGHLHSEQVKEANGIVIRNLPSVTGGDLWHRDSGYVGSIKRSQSFLWDKEIGLKCIFNTVIKESEVL